MRADTPLLIAAFDPGLNGAFALVDERQVLAADELPRHEKLLNATLMLNRLSEITPTRIVIERVWAMPGQGVSSTFVFGCAFGVCIGIAAALRVPVLLVSPGRWKSHFRLVGKPKDASRELACRLYPKAASMLALKKHHGRADAILMARYALDRDQGREFA